MHLWRKGLGYFLFRPNSRLQRSFVFKKTCIDQNLAIISLLQIKRVVASAEGIDAIFDQGSNPEQRTCIFLHYSVTGRYAISFL